MENLLSRVTINPEICNGKPIIRNMRITIRNIWERETIENLLDAYPILENKIFMPASNIPHSNYQ